MNSEDPSTNLWYTTSHRLPIIKQPSTISLPPVTKQILSLICQLALDPIDSNLLDHNSPCVVIGKSWKGKASKV